MQYVNEIPRVDKDKSGQTLVTFKVAGGQDLVIEIAMTPHAHTCLLNQLRVTQPGHHDESGDIVPFD